MCYSSLHFTFMLILHVQHYGWTRTQNLIGALNIASFDLLILDLKVHVTFEKFAKVTFTIQIQLHYGNPREEKHAYIFRIYRKFLSYCRRRRRGGDDVVHVREQKVKLFLLFYGNGTNKLACLSNCTQSRCNNKVRVIFFSPVSRYER